MARPPPSAEGGEEEQAWHPAGSGPEAEVMLSRTFGNTGVDATSYGLSPNFPCCTVNYAQGWPKLLALGAWLWDDGGGGGGAEVPALLSGAFLPSRLDIPEPVGGVAELRTEYPLAGPDAPLRFSLRGLRAKVALLVRVPEWADLQASEVHSLADDRRWSVADASAASRWPSDASARPAVLWLQNEGLADAAWEVRFRANWRLWHRPPWGGGFLLGPLAFVIPLAHQAVPMPPEDEAAAKSLPPGARDEELVSLEGAGAWSRVLLANASDPSATVELLVGAYASERLALASDAGACPLAARSVGAAWPAWQAAAGAEGGRPWLSLSVPRAPAASPLDPAGLAGELGLGQVQEVLLRPFGCTKLRMAQAPLVLIGGSASGLAAG